MFRKIVSFLVATIILAGFTGCSLSMVEREVVEKEYHTEIPQKMMFLGDSIPAGYGLDGYTSDDHYNCESYPNILRDRYTGELSEICHHTMQNFAVSGATSDDLLNLIDSGKLDSALADTDAVVVSIGGNDMLHIIFGLLSDLGLSAENRTIDIEKIDVFSALGQLLSMDGEINDALTDFEMNLQEISTKLSEKTSGEIYIQTLYNPLETFTDLQIVIDFSEEKINRYNEIIRNNADNYRIIDVAEKFDGKCAELTRIKQFDIHPNEEGHKLIAETVDSSFRATGFVCIVHENGRLKLTPLALILILSEILLITFILVFYIPKLFNKFKEKEKEDEI